MVRRLLTIQAFAYRLRDPEVVPFGGEPVLKAIAKLVAGSETGCSFAIDPDPLMSPGGFARQVVAMLRPLMAGAAAEQQVGALIDRLVQAKLVLRSETELRLPLPPAPPVMTLGRRHIPAMPRSLGSPGKLTEAEIAERAAALAVGRAAFEADDEEALIAAWMRLFAVQPSLRAKYGTWLPQSSTTPAQPARQTAMLLAVKGGAGRPDIASISPIDMPPADIKSDIDAHMAADVGGISEPDIEVDLPGSRAALEKNDDDDDLREESMSESSSSSSTQAARGGEADIGSDMAADMQSDIKSHIEPGAEGPLAPAYIKLGVRFAEGIGKPEQAAALGAMIGRLALVDPGKARVLPDLVERAVRIYAGGDHVSSPAALLRTMYAREKLREVSGPVRPPLSGPSLADGPASSRAVDPRIAAVPEWEAAEVQSRREICTMLDELARPGPARKGGISWIQEFHRQGSAGFRLAEQRHPELRRIAEDGWEAYLEEVTAPGAGRGGEPDNG